MRHEGGDRHANARTSGFQLASLFVCRHDLRPRLAPLQQISQLLVVSPNHPVPSFACFLQPRPTSFNRHLSPTRQQSKPIGQRGVR
jgi:hypothetical protein